MNQISRPSDLCVKLLLKRVKRGLIHKKVNSFTRNHSNRINDDDRAGLRIYKRWNNVKL